MRFAANKADAWERLIFFLEIEHNIFWDWWVAAFDFMQFVDFP